jgi:hypothetical protein
MKNQNGIILWVLGGTGVLFIVAAYKNKNPQALLADHLRGTTTSAPISGSGATVAAPASTPSVPSTTTDSSTGLYYGGDGNVLGTIPAVYQNNPALFIATGSVNA